jgi:hypothetical protein
MWKRFILWDYPRGAWQYDVVVAIILAFMFLTPRDWFRDQPRIPNASGIMIISLEPPVFFLAKEHLTGANKDQETNIVTQALQARTGNRRLSVTRVEEVFDSEGGLQGYMAYAKP